jgi:hypothetical protein
MSVYGDSARNTYGRMIMCHMIADTAAELHEMADKIGVDRRWFQAPPPKGRPDRVRTWHVRRESGRLQL